MKTYASIQLISPAGYHLALIADSELAVDIIRDMHEAGAVIEQVSYAGRAVLTSKLIADKYVFLKIDKGISVFSYKGKSACTHLSK